MPSWHLSFRDQPELFKFIPYEFVTPGEFVSATPSITPDEGTGHLFGWLRLWGGIF
jgi:hypothetical protein